MRSLEQEFSHRCREPSDINGHLATLREYASQCRSVVEFGVHIGNSTVALLAGGPEWLHSCDLHCWIDTHVFHKWALSVDTTWSFHRANALDLLAFMCRAIDLLFIDTWHHGIQLAAELALHAGNVQKWIILHDTETNAVIGSTGLPGMWPVVREFCQSDEWQIARHDRHNNGLTVLERVCSPKRSHPVNWPVVEEARRLSAERFDAEGVWIPD